MEWAVWANLDKNQDLELILLRGHLILELFIDSLLENDGCKKYKNLSFYSKVNLLTNIADNKVVDFDSIKTYLLSINNLRNKFAHEWGFDICESEIEVWSKGVISAFEAEKFSKYTYRTIVIHAFSLLSGALLEIQKKI